MTTIRNNSHLGAWWADYAFKYPGARLACLDADGQAYARPTPADLAEYRDHGTVRGEHDHAIGVVYTDGENEVATAFCPMEIP